MRHSTLVLAAVLSYSLCSDTHGSDILAFDRSSLQHIEQRHAGSPFIVVFWASDCAPCLNELELLRTFAEDHPEIPLVLVATDGMQDLAAVEQILEDSSIPSPETWQFAAESIEKLRYSVDPQWSGEVPRSYLYDGQLNRISVSGRLQDKRLNQWLDTVLPRSQSSRTGSTTSDESVSDNVKEIP